MLDINLFRTGTVTASAFQSHTRQLVTGSRSTCGVPTYSIWLQTRAVTRSSSGSRSAGALQMCRWWTRSSSWMRSGVKVWERWGWTQLLACTG